jgi:polyisoprenoid-binding protein YceI
MLTAAAPSVPAGVMTLDPSNSRISYTVNVAGLFPVRGAFRQFHGTVRADAAHPGACQVDVTVDVASLAMDSPARRRRALAPGMLDAAHYPTMHFTGACAPPGLAGALTMHGVTHGLALTLRPAHGRLAATGSLRRQDYGVTGLPVVIGSRVVIELSAPLPQ